MIVIGKTVLSDDIADNYFLCDLNKCKGGCCVEGDLGAPLEMEELPILDAIYEQVKPYLTPAGQKAIEHQGKYVLDEDKEYSTPTIHGKECAYASYDEKGILRCGIERAYLDGKTNFQKPVSCHLYPIRVTKYDNHFALNYDRWEICLPACELGRKTKTPLYKFLKDALIRKFGEVWYNKLCNTIENPQEKVMKNS
ncbi:MAG: DUF3109 family protein [Cyclobacteriaceae bacterium]|nr:DUF3109 family protein [Cyclobacteriaceae bacterium]